MWSLHELCEKWFLIEFLATYTVNETGVGVGGGGGGILVCPLP